MAQLIGVRVGNTDDGLPLATAQTEAWRRFTYVLWASLGVLAVGVAGLWWYTSRSEVVTTSAPMNIRQRDASLTPIGRGSRRRGKRRVPQ